MARRYDPALGRFIQPDTLVPDPGDPQALNRYSYVGNNPVRYTDPSGHRVVEDNFGAYGCNTGASIYDCIYPEGHPLAGYPIGTTEEDIAQATAEMKSTSAFVADVVPVVGDIKGLIEVATGKDVITGESLGHWRWLGLVGISEFRHIRRLRHVDELTGVVKFEKHHIVPREILRKYLPQEVANHPLVRGVRGHPNRWAIPRDLHREIHRGPGGGEYNRRWILEINNVIRTQGKITVEDVLQIRNRIIQEFGLEVYKP